MDLASFSAHKIGGPKGIGALYVKRGTKMFTTAFGGGQERGLRSGTEAVFLIAGFAEAMRLTYRSREADNEAMRDIWHYTVKRRRASLNDYQWRRWFSLYLQHQRSWYEKRQSFEISQ